MGLTETQQGILRAMRDGPRQAQELASVLEINISAAYRHLETLRQAGLTEATRTIGGPGRPKKIYTLTRAGWETFPRDYAMLLTALMQQVRERDGPQRLQAFMAAIAESVASPVRPQEPLQERLRQLVALYNGLGFEANLIQQEDRMVLEQRNCPFLEAARDDPQALCRCLDEGIIRTVLPEADVSLEATLAQDDSRCRHQITLPRKKPRRFA